MDRPGFMTPATIRPPRLRPDPAAGHRLARRLDASSSARSSRRRSRSRSSSFVLVKFSTIFIAVGGYALIWGWKFAIGLVAADPRARARPLRRGATRGPATRSCPSSSRSSAPTCKYTRGNPWQTARIAIAGPILGGVGEPRLLPDRATSQGSNLLLALAYFGFFLNLFNLLPIGILDGGAVWRSARYLRLGGGRGQGDCSSTRSTSARRSLLVLGMCRLPRAAAPSVAASTDDRADPRAARRPTSTRRSR